MLRQLGGVMNRRDAMQGIAAPLLAADWPTARVLAAGLGFAWDRVPAFALLGAADDPRQALVRDAVAFWNQTFSELGSRFRLGRVSALLAEIKRSASPQHFFRERGGGRTRIAGG